MVGALFALLCVTGSVLAFYQELDALLNPELVPAQAQRPRASYAQVFAALRAAEPARDGPWRLELPEDPARAYNARYYNPVETRGQGFAPLMLTVDPWRAEVMARRFWGDYAVTWLYDLHYTLLLGATGTWLVGAIGVLFVLALVAGLRLWWPTPGHWRAALVIKARASNARRLYDLHRALGAWSALVLLVLALTGVVLALPAVVNPLVAGVSTVREMPSPRSVAVAPGARDIGPDRAVQVALRVFPEAQVRWIESPSGVDGTWRIRMRQPGEPGRRFPKTHVWVDRYSGAVLAVHDPRAGGAGELLLEWMHPLHSGEAFAVPGRGIAAFAGIAGTVLFVTGLLRWRQRTRTRRRR